MGSAHENVVCGLSLRERVSRTDSRVSRAGLEGKNTRSFHEASPEQSLDSSR